MLKYSVAVCPKNHSNLVIIDRGDANERDIRALKRQAKSYGIYFNPVPQCYVCKEPFTGDAPDLTIRPDDAESIDAAAVAIHKVLKGN